MIQNDAEFLRVAKQLAKEIEPQIAAIEEKYADAIRKMYNDHKELISEREYEAKPLREVSDELRLELARYVQNASVAAASGERLPAPETDSLGVTFRRKRTWRVVDPTLIDREYMTPDIKAIGKEVNAMGEFAALKIGLPGAIEIEEGFSTVVSKTVEP